MGRGIVAALPCVDPTGRSTRRVRASLYHPSYPQSPSRRARAAAAMSNLHTARHYTLTLACPDRVGIVAAVAGFLASHGGWIVESSNYADAGSGWFFTRQVVLADSLPFDREELRRRFAPIAERYAMQWQVADSAHPKRVVVLVSLQDHCLYDLLHRWKARDFAFDIPCVISNHDTLRGFVEWHGIPFFHVPVEADRQDEAHAEVLRLYRQHAGEVMVLARYMRILPPAVCSELAGRILNIHHSFLPSFVGARPYHQAYEARRQVVGAPDSSARSATPAHRGAGRHPGKHGDRGGDGHVGRDIEASCWRRAALQLRGRVLCTAKRRRGTLGYARCRRLKRQGADSPHQLGEVGVNAGARLSPGDATHRAQLRADAAQGRLARLSPRARAQPASTVTQRPALTYREDRLGR